MCGCEASGGTRPPLPGGSPVPKGQACAHPASGAVIQRGALYYMFESGVTEALKLAAATPFRWAAPRARLASQGASCWPLDDPTFSMLGANPLFGHPGNQRERTHSTRPEAISSLYLSRTKARAGMADDAPQRSATPMLRGMWQAARSGRPGGLNGAGSVCGRERGNIDQSRWRSLPQRNCNPVSSLARTKLRCV